MIKIENVETVGWEPAIRGMRNPLNSWDKSDSGVKQTARYNDFAMCDCEEFIIGSSDHSLMMKLRNAGTDHRKFMRMIVCYCDITAPLYWWKEFDTYRNGVEKNSCSTMHKIAEKEFTLSDFSREHLFTSDCPCYEFTDGDGYGNSVEDISALSVLDITVQALNHYRGRYLETKDKSFWWQMIQLLPSSYNQRRTCMISYEALANMYHARKAHKLDEWREFCRWIEALPYSELITGDRNEKTAER